MSPSHSTAGSWSVVRKTSSAGTVDLVMVSLDEAVRDKRGRDIVAREEECARLATAGTGEGRPSGRAEELGWQRLMWRGLSGEGTIGVELL